MSGIKISHELRPCMVAICKGGNEQRALFHCYLVSANHLSIVAYRDIFGIGVTISNGSLYIQLGHLEFTWY